jgi:diguanylate cyclase (GGDEF)-like protein
MTDMIMNLRGSRKSLFVHFLVPVAVLLALAVGLVIATVIWTSEDVDFVAADQQRQRIVSALDVERVERTEQLASLTISEEAWAALQSENRTEQLNRIISRRAFNYFGFEGLYILEQNNMFVMGSSHGEKLHERDFTLRRTLFQNVVEDVKKKIIGYDHSKQADGKAVTASLLPQGTIIYDGKNAYFVVVSPIAPPNLRDPSQWLLAVAFKRIDMLWLQTFGAQHDITYLHLIERAPVNSQLSIPVQRSDGKGFAYFVWNPHMPGHTMRERLIPISLLVLTTALAFTLLIFYRIRKIEHELSSSEDQARQLIGHDPLSGLANRLLFSMRLDQELARSSRDTAGLAVFFLDLDRFKDVNDTHGHQAGDELIQGVAKRLSALLRTSDTLSRFGGDEFAIIQTNVKSEVDAEKLGRRILESITEPFAIAGTQVSVGVSIGIALAPENGVEREILMQLADTALYQSKNDGRNRYSFFESQMNETLRLRKLVEDELRDAINNDALALHYQPQVSPDGKTVLGVEALIRWPHSTKGMISPVQFISIAEERGLIVLLGEWVLKRACMDGMAWPNVRVAVNVSPIQFRHKDFVSNVKRILQETGFPPSRLEIELTEGVVVEDADAAEWAMMELKALGVQLALDDFGTGYSSLIYLRRFAFDKIKIDRSFLESMEGTGESPIIVHSIVHLGRALGLTVTAEGVETEEQHHLLQAVGCHELQGFLFSKPVPAPQITAMLQTEDQSGLQIAS